MAADFGLGCAAKTETALRSPLVALASSHQINEAALVLAGHLLWDEDDGRDNMLFFVKGISVK